MELVARSNTNLPKCVDAQRGKDVAPFIQPESGDRRFNSPLWQEHPNFDLLSQSYLLFSQLVQNMVDVVEGVPDKVRYRIHFFTRQMINALSPSNFLWTNPEVIQQTVAEQGENLVRGMQVFHDDVMNSGKYLSIRMVNSDSFSLGKDLAYTLVQSSLKMTFSNYCNMKQLLKMCIKPLF